MLHILFAILKFIGIVLGAILGIIVLLLCVVLFVPMRYKLEAACDGTLKGLEVRAKVSWICHLVSGYAIYQDEKLIWQMRILWKKLNVEKKQKKEGAMKGTPTKETATQETEYGTMRRESVPESETSENSETSMEPEEHNTSEKPKTKKKVTIFQKIKYTFQKICDKIKMLLEKKEKLEEFISDTVHRSAFSRVKQEIVRLGRFLRPKKIVMNVHFGLDDPYHTGRILAVLSMLYPFYGEHISVRPDFEEQILEGDLLVKGHIHGIHAVIIVWNLFFDKNIRTAYKNLKTFEF